MRIENRPTWLGYLDNLKKKHYEPEQMELTGFDHFINANSIAHSFFRHSVPVIYLLDYRSGLYINMSENFAGYKSECFLKSGISHTLEIYERAHLALFNKEIFPDRLQILKAIPAEEHKNYVFSYNSMIKNKNGSFEHFLQRSCFLSDCDGNPMFSMGILLNITHYHQGNLVTQSVDKIAGDGYDCETIHKKVYHLQEETKLFTKREKEILLWMAEGLSSKMIAEKMFVSEHTIVNHRRNMQDKTNMPNATALVTFALKKSVI